MALTVLIDIAQLIPPNLYQLILQNETQHTLVVFSYIYPKHNKLENVFNSFPENKIEIDRDFKFHSLTQMLQSTTRSS